MSIYNATHLDRAAREAAYAEATAKARRRRELTRRSDTLLARLESLNLARYGALARCTDFEAVRLTDTLARAINELLLEVGLPPQRLTMTRDALEAVWQAQDVIFGHPHDSEEDNTDER